MIKLPWLNFTSNEARVETRLKSCICQSDVVDPDWDQRSKSSMAWVSVEARSCEPVPPCQMLRV